jgi:hypothetical protein
MDIPTKEAVIAAMQPRPWDHGNKILYKLCEENFEHKEGERILTKVLFIGRIYAAAIERRKTKEEDNDTFYLGIVLPKFRSSEIDSRLKSLRQIEVSDTENIELILETHSYLTSLLKEITKLDKRSFSSKYLHFHLPELFFIYDSRASKALRNYIPKSKRNSKNPTKTVEYDETYTKFFYKCLELKKAIKDEYTIDLTPREWITYYWKQFIPNHKIILDCPS